MQARGWGAEEGRWKRTGSIWKEINGDWERTGHGRTRQGWLGREPDRAREEPERGRGGGEGESNDALGRAAVIKRPSEIIGMHG